MSKDFNIFHLFHWKRIIYDEAHEIENMAKTSLLKASLNKLKGSYHWNITGTPFPNGLDSFVNLMSYNTDFIKENSFCKGTDELVSLGFDSDIIKNCSSLFKRNTRDSIKQEYSGNILREILKLLDFTEEERNIYNGYLEGDKKKYSDFLIKLCCHPELSSNTKEMIRNCKTFREIYVCMVEHNKTVVEKERKNIEVLTKEIEELEKRINEATSNNIFGRSTENVSNGDLRMNLQMKRKMLTVTKQKYENVNRTYNYLKSSLEKLQRNCDKVEGEGDIEGEGDNKDNEFNNSKIDCPICMDEICEGDLSITKCGHKFCWSCIYNTYKASSSNSSNSIHFKCPTCNGIMKLNEIYVLKGSNNDDGNSTELLSIVEKVKSTKIGNIIYFLKNNIQNNDKIILFSQWDELLHKVGEYLSEYNINIVYCNGSVYQRKRAIHSFTNDPDTNVIMLSSRNAASGINLTVANKIILLEPVYGNKDYRRDIESQAIGRADRLGQNNPIEIFRFIIKDTIEEDILNNTIDDSKLKILTI
jgi:SNF2 family DNA or RNA helicase